MGCGKIVGLTLYPAIKSPTTLYAHIWALFAKEGSYYLYIKKHPAAEGQTGCLYSTINV